MGASLSDKTEGKRRGGVPAAAAGSGAKPAWGAGAGAGKGASGASRLDSKRVFSGRTSAAGASKMRELGAKETEAVKEEIHTHTHTHTPSTPQRRAAVRVRQHKSACSKTAGYTAPPAHLSM